MNTKVDPLGETRMADARAFDPHAALTVVQRIDFHAPTRQVAVVLAEEPDTEIATTSWARPALAQATEIVDQQVDVAAPSPAKAQTSLRTQRWRFLALGGAVAVLAVSAARAWVEREPARATQVTEPAQSRVASPASSARSRSLHFVTETPHAGGDTRPHLTVDQVQTLEAEAAGALLAADEATARIHYRRLAADGHDAAKRMLELLERKP